MWFAGRRVNDGLWHSLSLTCKNLQLSLSVDGDPPSNIELWKPVKVRGSFFFGGKEPPPSFSSPPSASADADLCLCAGCPPKDCRLETPAFQGCMQLIFIDNQPQSLSLVQQGLLGNFNELQFDICNMKDR